MFAQNTRTVYRERNRLRQVLPATDEQQERPVSDHMPPPSYPSSATPAGSGPAVTPPQQVTIAFWLYLLGALLSLVSLIISIATIGALKSDLQKQLAAQGQQLSDNAVNAAVGVSIAIAVVFGLLYLAAYVLFAFFMRRGANWARIVLLIVTVLSLFQVLGAYGVGGARVVVGVIATILIFLKPANEYFRAVKARKTGQL
jgi:hypothetical protein